MIIKTDQIADIVASAHQSLMENAEYTTLIGARCDADCLSGSLAFDTILAAQMIRERASPASPLKQLKLAPIARALSVLAGRERALADAETAATLERRARHGIKVN